MRQANEDDDDDDEDGARVFSEFIICYVESKKDNKWWLVARLSS